jgi:hypothetical protein
MKTGEAAPPFRGIRREARFGGLKRKNTNQSFHFFGAANHRKQL